MSSNALKLLPRTPRAKRLVDEVARLMYAAETKRISPYNPNLYGPNFQSVASSTVVNRTNYRDHTGKQIPSKKLYQKHIWENLNTPDLIKYHWQMRYEKVCKMLHTNSWLARYGIIPKETVVGVCGNPPQYVEGSKAEGTHAAHLQPGTLLFNNHTFRTLPGLKDELRFRILNDCAACTIVPTEVNEVDTSFENKGMREGYRAAVEHTIRHTSSFTSGVDVRASRDAYDLFVSETMQAAQKVEEELFSGVYAQSLSEDQFYEMVFKAISLGTAQDVAESYLPEVYNQTYLMNVTYEEFKPGKE